ncbi:ParA family protein [Janthinobacterium sp. B9-8]|uniref:ParA family protein n=1 Tax=Janthinobacterium sp. B9-8 TaxID=1236179 RepID=UPI00061CEEB0|nr:ParA family protein [Janthinobacterium sp. B9-8]AMC33902.1 cobyrinic acid a,c-diamide synthase [Janthinobacterium sp. B9-8]
MRSILIANPKGGSGKSTLSTHLAAWFAWQEEAVMLGDIDSQQSSRHWLSLRPSESPQIRGWDLDEEQKARPPKGTGIAVLDSPAGLHGKRLKQALMRVDHVVIPVLPSAFDMWASAAFFEELAEVKAIRREEISVAVVGMRVNPRTQSAQQLSDFLKQFDLPLLTCIRETQLYVQSIQRGLTLFDLPTSRTKQDRVQWQPLLDWLVSNKRQLR